MLFEELGLPQVKKTKKKTGYSTDVTVLTILAAQHPLPAEVLNYRTLAKIKGTYVDTLPVLVNPDTGRVHTSFNQAVTATGRLSSSDPNLQNIPVRSDLGLRIRQCFVPEPGRLMLSADYSQIELRVLAHLSQDPLLLQDMAQGLDVHTQTASRLFEVEPGQVTKEMRARAKTVNFGVLYGMSAFRLAREQGISNSEAQEIIHKYLGRYAGIAAFQQANLAGARDRGYVTTLLGRRRFLPTINSSDRVAREAAERVALNTPIQGTAADLIKLAMLKVQAMLEAEYPRGPDDPPGARRAGLRGAREKGEAVRRAGAPGDGRGVPAGRGAQGGYRLGGQLGRGALRGQAVRGETVANFERYIGIDYSGAGTPDSRQKGLRVYLAKGGGEAVEVRSPVKPAWNWTRRELANWLLEQLREKGPALVGIDHAFSFPKNTSPNTVWTTTGTPSWKTSTSTGPRTKKAPCRPS